MKKFWKNRAVWAIFAVLLLGAGVVGWWWMGQPPRGTTLVFAHNLRSPKVVEAVAAELRVWEGLNPGVSVSFIQAGTSEPDVAILENYPGQPDRWVFPLTPWSGNLWVLAANRPLLNELAQDQGKAVAALRAGTLDPAGFVGLLKAAKARGVSPITLGNSHLWPFLLWLQTWTAATLGPEAAVKLPGPEGGYSGLKAPMDELRRWRSLGWFDQEAWPLGWAQGLQPLQKGRAVFALISEPQLTALSVETRSRLEFLPFPRRPGDGPWSLGNAEFLAVSSTARVPAQAAGLIRFLTSPGTMGRLAGVTGRPFFAWNAADGKAPVVLADWTSQANEPGFRALSAELTK